MLVCVSPFFSGYEFLFLAAGRLTRAHRDLFGQCVALTSYNVLVSATAGFLNGHVSEGVTLQTRQRFRFVLVLARGRQTNCTLSLRKSVRGTLNVTGLVIMLHRLLRARHSGNYVTIIRRLRLDRTVTRRARAQLKVNIISLVVGIVLISSLVGRQFSSGMCLELI